MIVSPKDYVFFTIDKEYADKLCTSSGFELDLVVTGDPGQQLQHVREFGEVVSVPFLLSQHLNTSMDIQVGDRIYFHFHTVCDENRHEVDDKVYYRVHYSEIYCAIRDCQIVMLNDYLLCEPVMETDEELTSPGGIILKSKPEPKTQQAIILHIGKPPAKYYNELSVGDHILYSKHSDIPITIEGKQYYRMKRHDVIARFLTKPGIT